MNNFSIIIKQLRESKNLTQKELSEILGMKTYTTITKWEAGENFPKGKDIKKLAEIFSVSSDYLLGLEKPTSLTLSEINRISSKLHEPRQQVVLDTASTQLEEQNEEAKAKEREDKIISLKSNKPFDVTKIPGYLPYEPDKMGVAPILGDIAAGYNIMAAENFSGMMAVSAEYAGRDDVFWLKIVGNSMESLIHDGAYGLFENIEDAADGQICAIMAEDGDWVTVKRVFHSYDDKGRLKSLTLIPENKDCNTIELNEGNSGKIIGRLLETKQFF